jgi:Carboxypeptidase regulatory-like domain
MKIFKLPLYVCLAAVIALAQGNRTRIDGTVTDPSGAAVPAAEVVVSAIATGQSFNTSTNERGEWAVTTLDAGTYKVAVTKPGFKVASVTNVILAAGVPGTVSVKLEVGQATEVVTVQSGAEVVQAQSAEVSNTLSGRQVTELPFATRNAIELMVTQPGTSTPGNPRSSTINGLPKGAINITIDGMNTQDNLLKSNDGFFSYIMPSVDSLEEVTLTTSAGGVDSTAQGAAQIKFVTKSGTNQYHGGGFYQVRNTFFNSNYFFNNQNGLPRDIIHLRQYGGHIGGPIIKDKLFVFGNYERYRYPGTASYTRTVPLSDYTQGIYTYQDTAGVLHKANLLAIAAAANGSLPAGTRQFVNTVDPIIANTYSQINKLTSGGNLKSNTGSGDYNFQTYSYQPTGLDARDFWTARFDYNVSQKHHLSFTYDYDKYTSAPDILNNVVPVYAGTGTVLGNSLVAGQRSNRFVGTLSLRSAVTSRLTNELRGGLNGGTVLFRDTINDGLFSQWRGFSPGISGGAVTTTTTPSRRNGPYKDVADTVSWVKGSHQVTAGANWSQVNLFQKSIGSESIPSIAFGTATGDPLITGTNAPFQIGANFPNASSAQVSSMASAYANLVGRVSSITRREVLDETTHKYAFNTGAVDRNEEQWWGIFGQDVWRVAPTLTATFGLRWEKEGQWKNTNTTYTSVSLAGLWGTSGIGHLFQPGATGGVTSNYEALNNSNTYKMPAVWAPSVGLAWQLPAHEGLLGVLFGHHTGAAVLRAGYSISTIREGSQVYQSVYGANQGLLVDASLSASTFPTDFGAPGSVLFRDATLPQRSGLPAVPAYPIAANFTNSLNAFDPKLRMSYVQSWNLGFQRELNRNTVVEFRYTGNHGLKEWRQYNLNEVNTVENGFQGLFAAAANNLRIARGGDINNLTTNNFGNQGLAGQVAIPFIQSMLGTSCCTDSTTAGFLTLGQVGSMANSNAGNATRNANMVAAGYPANFFVVNPQVAGNGTYIVQNLGSSFYDSGQLEVRRRMAAGFQIQGNYSLSKAISNGATSSSSDFSQPTTLRNLNLDRAPNGFDIRHAIKVNSLYELPFGAGRTYLSGVSNRLIKKALEGWQVAGVMRWQSGVPTGIFTSGFATFNGNSSGAVLHNITMRQLQDMIEFRKGQNPVGGLPLVSMLPFAVAPTGLTSSNNTNFITNTQAAFNTNNLTPAQVNPNAPYIGPAAPGKMGCLTCYVYLPWQRHFDLSLVKVTHLRESVTLEIRAQALNVFNITNFNGGNGIGSSMGQVTSAYRDLSGTVDPGGRILEFVGRINF